MKSVTIDITKISSAQEFHQLLKERLEFPDYYGMNNDALHDVIGLGFVGGEVEPVSDIGRPFEINILGFFEHHASNRELRDIVELLLLEQAYDEYIDSKDKLMVRVS